MTGMMIQGRAGLEPRANVVDEVVRFLTDTGVTSAPAHD
jgi:hypothetical protein